MIPAKVKVFFAFFPYGGNGGTASEHPSIRNWFAETIHVCKNDERIECVLTDDFSDTPITMTRNRAVKAAQESGADFLVMCDSDQHPDREREDPLARPFWQSSFDFAYQRRMQNKISVIGAPYCGPPPFENVYVFRWGKKQNDHPDVDMSIDSYCREEAAIMQGIHEAAALPTGLILFDIKAFDIIQPPYFYYEYTDEYEHEKASTEDVTCTRDIALAGQEILGYGAVFCNWDSWAGHYKPKCVRKPKLLTVENVNETYRQAVLKNRKRGERLTCIRQNIPHIPNGWTVVARTVEAREGRS